MARVFAKYPHRCGDFATQKRRQSQAAKFAFSPARSCVRLVCFFSFVCRPTSENTNGVARTPANGRLCRSSRPFRASANSVGLQLHCTERTRSPGKAKIAQRWSCPNLYGRWMGEPFESPLWWPRRMKTRSPRQASAAGCGKAEQICELPAQDQRAPTCLFMDKQENWQRDI